MINETLVFTHLKQQNNTYWTVKKTILATLSVVMVFMASCRRDPGFELTPEIEFENIFFETSIVAGVGGGPPEATDQFVIFLRFQDGDGDLGFTQADLTDPKFESISDTTLIDLDNDGIFDDTTTSPRNFNATLFRKNQGIYEEVETTIPLGGSFQPLISTDELGPIEGTLRHNFTTGNRASFFANTTVEPDDTVRFEVFIIDRELNRSNTIVTSDVVIPAVSDN